MRLRLKLVVVRPVTRAPPAKPALAVIIETPAIGLSVTWARVIPVHATRMKRAAKSADPAISNATACQDTPGSIVKTVVPVSNSAS